MLFFHAFGVLASYYACEQETDYKTFIATQNYQGIPCVSGELGSSEQEELREGMTRFNLERVFAGWCETFIGLP